MRSEYECVVHELCSREVFCVHHELERFNFNPRTHRRDTHIRGRGRPYSETSPDQTGGGDGNRGGHLSSPVQINSRQLTCQTHGFGGCDGHASIHIVPQCGRFATYRRVSYPFASTICRCI